jgi:hypothetical protein
MNRAMFEEEVWLEDEYLDGAQGECLLKAADWWEARWFLGDRSGARTRQRLRPLQCV